MPSEVVATQPSSRPVRALVRRRARQCLAVVSAVAAVHAGLVREALSQSVYWDTNAAVGGSGNAAAGQWDQGTTANWSLNAAGDVATTTFASGNAAVFSAGTDNVATTVVSVAGTVNPSSITFNSQLTTFTVAAVDGTSLINFGSTVGSINSAASGAVTTGKQFAINTNLAGTGGLTIASHGSPAATGGASNSRLTLTGDNTGLTGGIAITSGLVGVTNFNGDATVLTRVFGNNTITLSDQAGIVDANLNVRVGNNIVVTGGAGILRAWGSATTTYSGVISGAGGINFTDSGVRVLTSANTFLGAAQIQSGTVQLGDNTATGSIATASSLNIAAATTLRVRRTGTVNLTSLVPTNLTLTGTLQQRGATAADELVVTSTVGSDVAIGAIQSFSGKLTFGTNAVAKAASVTSSAGAFVAIGAGADVRTNLLVTTAGNITMTGGTVDAATLQLSSAPASSAASVLGFFDLQGGNITTRFANIGNGAGNAGKVNQTGGTMVVQAGGNGFRIGHWDNGALTPGSEYNISGGLLDASAVPVNVGWDGAGTLNVSGTGVVKAQRLYVDAAGIDRPGVVNLQTGGTIEVGTGGTANDGTVGSMLNLAGGTMTGVASGTWASKMDANDGTTTTLSAAAGARVAVTGVLSGNGAVTQSGPGDMAWNATANTYTGVITSAAGSTLSGTGTLRAVTVNGTINPGASGAPGIAGTLTVGSESSLVELNNLVEFDLNGASTSAGNDLLNVEGDFTLGAASRIRPTFYGVVPTSGTTYNLINYSSSLTGTPTLDPAAVSSTRLVYALDTSSAGQINLTVTGESASIVWAGGNNANAWDVNTTTNWLNGATPDKFFDFDTVSFTTAGNNATPVNITGTVRPVAITVSADKDYAFGGSGSIVGPSLTKSGTGTLTLLTNNALGAIDITGGAVNVGNGGTTGSIDGTAAINLATGTTLRINRSDAMTLSRAFSTTSSGALIKEGAGNLTLSGGFTLLPTTVTVDGGTLTVTGGSFGGNRLVGNGLVTVNAGATLLIPAGNFHAFGSDGGAMTESFVINAGGTFTINQEQYFKNLTLSGATVNGTGEVRTAAATILQVTGTTPSTVANPVNMVNAANWTVADVTGSAAADVTLSGVVSNTGALVKSGPGTLLLSSANTYTGATVISQGTLKLGNATAAGPAATAVVTLNNAATGSNNTALLSSLDNTTLAYNVTVANQGTGVATIGSDGGTVAGGLVYSGIMTLNRPTVLQGVNTDKTLFSGLITGSPGTLTISGGSRVTIRNTTNDFVGDIAVTGTNTRFQTSENSAGEVLPNASSVSIGAGARMQLAGSAGSTETINGLSGVGLLTRNVVGTQTFVVGSAGGGGLFGGIIENGTGVIALTKTGAGSLTLTGASTYSGATTLTAGTLLANTAGPGSATGTSAVTVNGGTLGGSGRIAGTVTANLGSTVAPGAPGAGPGVLTIAGPLTLGTASSGTAPTVQVELGAGTSSDVLALTGVGAAGLLTLSNPDRLDLVPLQNITASTTYTIATFASMAGEFNTVLVNGGLSQSTDSTAANFVSVVYNPTSIQVTVNNLAAVPEPASALVAMAGFGLLAMRRRRRVRA